MCLSREPPEHVQIKKAPPPPREGPNCYQTPQTAFHRVFRVWNEICLTCWENANIPHE